MAPSSYSYVRLLSLRMVIMAGMLPGVEFARRRRRASSLCLYAPSSKEWSSTCMEATATARAWTTLGLGSGAREAKERLDQKLRAQRQPVVLKRCVCFCCLSVPLLHARDCSLWQMLHATFCSKMSRQYCTNPVVIFWSEMNIGAGMR